MSVIRVILVCVFPAFSHIRTESDRPSMGKMRTRTTPNTDTFYAVIVWDVHLKLTHASCKQVLTEIRQKFWVTHSRQYLRNIVRKCVIFLKLHAKPYFYPKLFPLNELRLQDKRAFSTIEIDMFGPLLAKDVYENANNEMHKACVTVYTCASTRNIILDLIPSLSANSQTKQFKTFYKS